jgi:lysophospholipase L1-like esterase
MVAYRHVVALGSSFAAGPGSDPVVDRAAMRSGRNYAHLLADRLGAKLTDLTVSGATTATLLERPQRTLRGKRFPPQVDGIPADADLVTVTAGGNDLGYVGGMMRAALAGRLRARLLTRPIGGLVGRNAVPAATDADVERATSGLARVVEAARTRAPGARAVLVDLRGARTSCRASDQGFYPRRSCPFASCICSWSGCSAGWRSSHGATPPKRLRSWCCGMRSRSCAVRSPARDRIGPTERDHGALGR